MDALRRHANALRRLLTRSQRGGHLCPSRNHLTAEVRSGKRKPAIKMHYSSLKICGGRRWG
jgi:hypothetical protein